MVMVVMVVMAVMGAVVAVRLVVRGRGRGRSRGCCRRRGHHGAVGVSQRMSQLEGGR